MCQFSAVKLVQSTAIQHIELLVMVVDLKIIIALLIGAGCRPGSWIAYSGLDSRDWAEELQPWQ